MSNTLPDLIDRSRPAVVAVGTFSATDNPRFGFRGTGFRGRRRSPDRDLRARGAESAREGLDDHRARLGQTTGQPQLRAVKLVRRDALHDLAVLELTEGKPLTEVLSLATVEEGKPTVGKKERRWR
ncbi:hypothetical protein Ddc_20132 [Ditylenchus destructor]|nr:hypothetical protein Ddc_20132 [Ditylenchus destructor]